jgi:hypothetical protein
VLVTKEQRKAIFAQAKKNRTTVSKLVRTAGRTVARARPYMRKVSKTVALAVLAKIKAGKSSVQGEARRLGVYHATLRKEMRAAIGSKAYDKMVLRGRKPSIKSKPASRAAPPVIAPKPARRRAPSVTRIRRRTRYQSAGVVLAFSQVEEEFRCGRCGSDHLKPGTDGSGGGVLWCLCGWTRAIPRVRPTATTVV